MSDQITPATSIAIKEPHYERVGLAGLGASGGVLAINSMAEAVSVAQLMAKSGIAIRKHLRDQTGACLGVLMQALRWEMDPYMVGNKSYAVNDQLAYEAQLIAAVVLTRAAIVDEPDYTYSGEAGTTRQCTVKFKMRSGKTLEYTTPEVKKITTKNSPLWKSDEDQQLGYFAVRSWARRHQPHVLLGVYTVEEAQEVIDVTPGTSGLAARLPGAQEGAGFNRDTVEAEGERAAPRAARASRKPKAPAEEPEEPTHAAQPPEADDAKEPEAQIAEAKEAAQLVGLTEASEDVSEAEGLQGLSAAQDALDDEITEGYPAENEVYMLNGDAWEFNAQRGEERRDTYKNGEPFSDAGRDKGYRVYEDHAPARSAPEPEAEEEDGDHLPPDFKAFIDATETATSWEAVKNAFKAFQGTELWNGLSLQQQNHVRRQTWETLVDRANGGDDPPIEWLPDHQHDVSAFRLWIEAQDDATAVKGELALLQADPGFQAKGDGLKAQISDAALARIETLEG